MEYELDSRLHHSSYVETTKKNKHSAPDVDDKDVPKKLRFTSTSTKKNEWDIDDNWDARWDWVLDEMIWVFNQKAFSQREWEDQIENTPEDIRPGAHEKRMKNSFRLFGKYYQNLWD